MVQYALSPGELNQFTDDLDEERLFLSISVRLMHSGWVHATQNKQLQEVK